MSKKTSKRGRPSITDNDNRYILSVIIPGTTKDKLVFLQKKRGIGSLAEYLRIIINNEINKWEEYYE